MFLMQLAARFRRRAFNIVDTAGASVQAGSYYKVNGLRVSLLTPGDRYNYASKVVTSSKSAIGAAYYYGSAYNSADIFAALETSKSLTRTVDQAPMLPPHANESPMS